MQLTSGTFKGHQKDDMLGAYFPSAKGTITLTGVLFGDINTKLSVDAGRRICCLINKRACI